MEYESLFKAARKAGTALADVEPQRLGRILQHAARLLRGHTPALLEANARDIEANQLHRLRHGSRIAPALASGRGTGALDAPQRHDHRQAPRTVRRGRHGLRSPPQCHGRHLRPLRQDGQRLRPERGQRRPPLQRGDRGAAARSARRRRHRRKHLHAAPRGARSRGGRCLAPWAMST